MGVGARPGLAAALLALSALAQACSGRTAEEPVGAHLVCEEDEVDFGPVFEGDLLEHEFVFEVVGEGLEAIETVRADCGCTLAQLQVEDAEGTLRPYENGSPLTSGSRVHVQVSYNTRGKHGKAPRTITLYAAEGAVTARVLADVSPWLRVEPEFSDLGILRETESAQTSFEVASAVGKSFRLSHLARALPPQVAVQLTPLDADGRPGEAPARRWRVDVRLGVGMPRGSHIYPIELRTDQFHRHGAPILATPQLTVQVVGPVSLTPGSLAFGIVPPRSDVSRTTRYVVRDPDLPLVRPTLRLESVRPAGLDLASHATLRVLDVPGERAFDLRVTLSGLEPLPQGNFFGRLVVETGLEREPSLEAPLTGVVLPGGAGTASTPASAPENG